MSKAFIMLTSKKNIIIWNRCANSSSKRSSNQDTPNKTRKTGDNPTESETMVYFDRAQKERPI